MLNLSFSHLRRRYADGALTPVALAEMLSDDEAGAGEGIWIHRLPRAEIVRAAEALEERKRGGTVLPLYGLPFAVKDNIDVAGLPTTAACPAFAHEAKATAPAVERLLAAGALLVGKTNLDQFATGLVGVRSPYGVPTNPFDDRYIVGGSSSGSAAAVARGLVSFALGTDTAGSGRVPAAFTNIVGWKPSPGLVSTRGVVPACRSLDCVSVLALTVNDAWDVAEVIVAADAEDPYSRTAPAGWAGSGDPGPSRPGRWGVPRPADLEFFGDDRARSAFAASLARLRELGALLEEVDFAPFFAAASLLYDGPWIAERLAGLEDFIERRSEAILPVTLEILREGKTYPGTRVFSGLHRLAELRRKVSELWQTLDGVVVPTTPTIYRIDEVAAQPRLLNARLGRYVSFVNLLDLAGLAVPGGLRADGLPAGITLLGPWGCDRRLAELGSLFHQRVGGNLGATGTPLPPDPIGRSREPARAASPGADAAATIALAVVGAHLEGEPLNHQLTGRGGRLERRCRTAPRYRLHALTGTDPAKPGLVRQGEQQDGFSIEVEVWRLPGHTLGSFLAGVPSPLCIGTVELEDGARVLGFLCESHAVAVPGAEDISHFGGWRAYRGAGSR